MNPLKERYLARVIPQMIDRFNYTNPMEVPKIIKITVNRGVGEAKTDSKILDQAVEELKLITGQKPIIRKARKSIASFKLRKGMPIGCMVTLRGEKMYGFFDKLINIAIPRIRDFKGFPSKSFDGRGNFSLGVTEQLIFPEIPYEKVGKIMGMNISITTTAKTDEEGRALLELLGCPFAKV